MRCEATRTRERASAAQSALEVIAACSLWPNAKRFSPLSPNAQSGTGEYRPDCCKRILYASRCFCAQGGEIGGMEATRSNDILCGYSMLPFPSGSSSPYIYIIYNENTCSALVRKTSW
jgi:hypothetical protein